MNYELSSVLDYLEREKGIEKENLIEAVEASLVSASKKSLDFPPAATIRINRQTFEIQVLCPKTVVARVKDDKTEIALAPARKINPDAKEGDVVEVERGLDDFGRIAAQTAKQVITQKIKEAERDTLFNEYNARIGDVVTGIVRRFEKGAVMLDLGRIEAILPVKERVPTEDYSVGSRIRVCVISVKKTIKGPEIVVSRSCTDLVKKLFEMEVSEIHEGTVQIRAIAREPGYRTKVAVYSNDPRVDALGACVGMKGARVKNIVKELGGEKVDIIKWSPDMHEFITNALAPVTPSKILIGEDKITVLVSEDQLALCIGKKGQNARLCSRLVDNRIDIESATPVDRKKRDMESLIAEAKQELKKIPGVTEEVSDLLVKAGFTTIEGIRDSEAADLAAIEGMDAALAQQIIEFARAHAEIAPESAGDPTPGTDDTKEAAPS